MDYCTATGSEVEFIDFCTIANQNGMTCPPSTGIICIRSSDAIGQNTDDDYGQFIYSIYISASETRYMPTQFDGPDGFVTDVHGEVKLKDMHYTLFYDPQLRLFNVPWYFTFLSLSSDFASSKT